MIYCVTNFAHHLREQVLELGLDTSFRIIECTLNMIWMLCFSLDCGDGVPADKEL